MISRLVAISVEFIVARNVVIYNGIRIDEKFDFYEVEVMITNDEFIKWQKQGAIITKNEYKMLMNIVRESVDVITNAHIKGSNEFIDATAMEIEKRLNMVEKLRYLGYVKT